MPHSNFQFVWASVCFLLTRSYVQLDRKRSHNGNTLALTVIENWHHKSSVHAFLWDLCLTEAPGTLEEGASVRLGDVKEKDDIHEPCT